MYDIILLINQNETNYLKFAPGNTLLVSLVDALVYSSDYCQHNDAVSIIVIISYS